jgi:hypothetical protein
LRKTNYRQQKKSREDAQKKRNTEKKERRQAPTDKVIETEVTPSPENIVQGPN